MHRRSSRHGKSRGKEGSPGRDSREAAGGLEGSAGAGSERSVGAFKKPNMRRECRRALKGWMQTPRLDISVQTRATFSPRPPLPPGRLCQPTPPAARKLSGELAGTVGIFQRPGRVARFDGYVRHVERRNSLRKEFWVEREPGRGCGEFRRKGIWALVSVER